MSELEVEPYYESSIESLDEFNTFSNDDLRGFSKEKRLYDSQVKAIQNALKLLKYYSEETNCSNETIAKEELYKLLYDESDSKIDNHKLRLKQKDLGGQTFRKLEERYPVHERSRYGYDYREIDFKNFANQMGFWMATGSGKTLVLIKLMELTQRLMEMGEIPERELLLLVPSEEIREQFANEIEDYNTSGEYTISVHNAEDVNSSTQSTFKTSLGKTIDLYVKRADLISDETKEKEISFEDIENGGEWYVFLDEAHKGQSDSSKRQAYYSILARNGFLFNASATFTDPSDIATTVFNYNIEKFNADGYGKNIFVADQSLESITDSQFEEETKRKTVLESLIALTAQKKAVNETEYDYHNPLLTAFVNSVNTTDSDLEMFFEVIEEIGKSENEELFEDARKSVSAMIRSSESEFEFGSDEFTWTDVKDITKKDVLKQVYNAESHASLEVKHSPDNKREIGFKLKSASKPFALIRIGDNSDWLSEKLSDKSVEETYDYRSYFDSINDSDSPINLLLGSRTFYEGWDSNRPNVMMFINLGRSDKKKLIMQAIGRGMRIEPESGFRKRAKYANLPIENKTAVSTIESLMVFATSVDNLEDILGSFKWVREQDHYERIENIERNSETVDKNLLTPTYTEGGLPDLEKVSTFEGDRERLQKVWDSLGQEMIMFHTGANNTVYKRMKRFLFREKFHSKFNKPKYEQSPIKRLKRLKSHLSKAKKEQESFDDANIAEGKIIHFKNIEADVDKVSDIAKIEETVREVNVTKSQEEVREYGLNIESIENHFYSPVLYTEYEEDGDAFKNIIDVPSEVEFINKVAEKAETGFFDRADWWHFSALSEHLDDVYIPYADDKKFRPDFIFWVKMDDTYHIIFVDPKSEALPNLKKIEGYTNVFMENGGVKEYSYGGRESDRVKVHLRMFNSEGDMSRIPDEYTQFFTDRLEEIEYQVHK